MKNALLVLACVMSFNAFSQTTYLADTAFVTDIGYDGAPASCIFGGGNTYGWQFARTSDKWLADAFTVPADSIWSFDTVIVYGYQVGSTTSSTFTGCNLEIYNGAPGISGSVIWGDTSTNVMVATGWTGMYRVDTNASDGGLTQTTRPIMYLKLLLYPAAHLSAGTYWLAFSATGSLTATISSPPKVLPGRINPAGQQERQLLNGAWDYVSDNGHNTGINIIIKASAVAEGVPIINRTSPVSLGQNIPNPFTENTSISFYMPLAGHAKVSVYNITGQLVATPVNDEMSAGSHYVNFLAADLPAGNYFYKLETAEGSACKQMQITR